VAELKTQPTGASVEAFLDALPDDEQRADARSLTALVVEVVGAPPEMWGAAIIGVGRRVLRYPNGRELDWMTVGLAPRKGRLVLYLPATLDGLAPQLATLGRHTTGKGCVYLRRLADVDHAALRRLVEAAVQRVVG
jgi:hypothetical protein